MKKQERGKMTAQIAAFARALGSHDADPQVRNPDYLAERLLPAVCRLAFLPLTRGLFQALYDSGARGMYCYHQIRTRYVDELVLAELDRGVEQLVILGAGLDTRAFRFSAQLQQRPVFEVDHPATQGWKLAQLARLPPAGRVHFVAVNFETEDLGKRLAEAGFEPGRRSLFLWEGVSMYLTEEAVSAMLATLSRSKPGSSVVFDYIYRGMLEGRGEYFGACQSLRSARRLGEPYIFGLEPSTIAEFLSVRGFDLVSDVDAAELSARYLRRADGRLLGRSAAYARFAHAAVRPAGPRA